MVMHLNCKAGILSGTPLGAGAGSQRHKTGYWTSST